MHGHTGEGREAARLSQVYVGVPTDDDGVAPVALREDGHHVALGAAGNEDGVFLAEPLGGHRFEPVYGGVLALVGVAKLGLGDCHTHFHAWQGLGVTP